MSDINFWSEETRQKAANNVYHSIDLLEKLSAGWAPDPYESPSEQLKQRTDMYESNLQFLKNTLNEEYYEGFLDTKRVEDAIAAAEANPIKGGGGEG